MSTNPIGRPTTYKPEYCEIVIKLMSEGYSKTAVAGLIGTTRHTLIDWTEKNPEFLHAIKMGEAARTAFLEGGLLRAPDGPTVTSRIFALKNAAPEEWKDKQEQEISGPGGGPLQVGWLPLTDK